VIEVGIDVPNATVMMIEGAERFGLAQLYQFRGRVGRGKYQSYCFLFTETNNTNSHKRLEAILKAKNSFELAELDLQMRGPGEFLGKRQSGLPDYFMEALKNLNLIEITKKEAENLLNNDPELKQYPLLKEKTEQQLSILEMLH
jgi:ATP-dependent DNA helicase RecG